MFRIVSLFILVALFAIAGLAGTSVQAQAQISISPDSGHWNYPNSFTVRNNGNEDIAIRWLLDCWDHSVCSDSSGTTTLAPGQSFSKGLGNICAKWQLDLWWDGGSWGGIAEISPDCYEPTPTAPPPTEPTPTPPPPSPTPEIEPTEEPTPTPTVEPTVIPPTPTQTATPILPSWSPEWQPEIEPTPAPMVPHAGIGDLSSDGFTEIGSVTMSDRTLPLYEGIVEDGQVQIARYGMTLTLHNEQYWIHRVQEFGWIRFQEGDEMTINGVKYRLVALDRTQGYDFTTDQLPEGILATCYADGEEWAGLDLFKLVKIVPPRHDHHDHMVVAQ